VQNGQKVSATMTGGLLALIRCKAIVAREMRIALRSATD
jgi:hypothetical protein